MELQKPFSGAKHNQSSAIPAQDTSSSSQDKDYDFVEEPDQDCYCSVSLGLLLDPYLTSCCGQHISHHAASRLVQEGQPCPMCRAEQFNIQVDKYFKRNTINKLKVHCPYKKNGCEQTVDLGDLDHHSTSCPKRPWKCQHCDFECTYETGTNDHTSSCTKYPLLCPNQCGIGTVPRSDAEKHQLLCPLVPVECEFANTGCTVKVTRRDLAEHMTENAQYHLTLATLQNLRLTKELHQKMEEKDQQIADLQRQLREQQESILERVDKILQEQARTVKDKLQQSTADLELKLKQQAQDLETKADLTAELHQSRTVEKVTNEVGKLMGYTSRVFTVTEFTKWQRQGGDSSWQSKPFYNYYGGYKFKLNIDTNGYDVAQGTHLSAFLCSLPGDHDEQLSWPVKVTVQLVMLNQRGDHSHQTTSETIEFVKCPQDTDYPAHIWGLISSKLYPLDGLGYDSESETEYLKDDCVKFVLRLKTQ